MFIKHGIKRPVRAYVSSTRCACCLFEHHTRARIIKHLANVSPVCEKFYFNNVPKLSDDEVLALDTDEKNQIRDLRVQGLDRGHTFNLAAYRVCGPLRCDFVAGCGSLKPGRNKGAPFLTVCPI